MRDAKGKSENFAQVLEVVGFIIRLLALVENAMHIYKSTNTQTKHQYAHGAAFAPHYAQSAAAPSIFPLISAR